MRRLSVAACSLMFALVGSNYGLAQNTGPHALFRIERLQTGQAVCALVDESGVYRIEKLFRAKSGMYSGTLDAARIEQLRVMLANETLRRFSQQDIRQALVSDTLDTVQLAIWRDRGWQELLFASSDSRKAIKDQLDPLLRWFHDLEKERPRANRVEGAATRCLPAEQIAVRSEVSSLAQPAVRARPSALFLFTLHSSHFYSGNVESSCAVVFADGRYHAEHANQVVGSDRRDRIVEGQIDAGALHELRTILDAPELKTIPGSTDGQARLSVEVSSSILAIPRENETQRLIFSDRFNTVGGPNAAGGRSNLNYQVGNERLLQPLHRWIKANTDPPKSALGKDANGNGCAVVWGSVSEERSSK